MNTSLKHVKNPPKAQASQATENLVASVLPEKYGTKRRINYLWEKDGTTFFRVNFHAIDGSGIESYWVVVVGNNVKVTPD